MKFIICMYETFTGDRLDNNFIVGHHEALTIFTET